MDCKDCPELIKRYGYCPVKKDWVTKPTDSLSFDIGGTIPRR